MDLAELLATLPPEFVSEWLNGDRKILVVARLRDRTGLPGPGGAPLPVPLLRATVLNRGGSEVVPGVYTIPVFVAGTRVETQQAMTALDGALIASHDGEYAPGDRSAMWDVNVDNGLPMGFGRVFNEGTLKGWFTPDTYVNWS